MTGNVIEFAPRQQRARKPKRQVPAGTPLTSLIDSWELKLRAGNKADTTIKLYLRSARLFTAFLRAQQLPDDAEGVTAEHVRMFLVAERERAGVPTAIAHHSYLGVWFNWMISPEEQERTTFSPVLKEDKPQLPKKARKYLSADQVVALLQVCKGSDFAARRDTAIIMVFFDNGVRVGGLTSIRLEDVDLRQQRLRIVLKGGNERWVPVGRATAQAIDRYLRVRARHPHADSPWLWLGVKSRQRFGCGGVEKMLHRRGEQAGVEDVHPHRFRRSSAHELLAAGVSPEDVKRILGWETDAMLRHYTEELAVERAAASHARHSPSDRL